MKIRRRTVTSALLAVVLAGLASPLHAAKYKIHWLLAHKNLDFFEEAAVNFKETVERGSHGDIQVDIVTAVSDGESDNPGEPSTAPRIADSVAKGEAEMGHSFTDVLGKVDPRFMAFEAPFLFRDYRHLEGVFEGPVGADMLDGLRAHKIVGLSFTYSGGASGVASVEREIRKPADLKGLKVGVYGDEVNAAWLRAAGASPVAIEHRLGSIPQLAQDGALDAVVITWRNFERQELSERFKYFNLPGSTHLVSVTYVNEAFFKSLPEEYRALITKASREGGRIERAKTIELNERAKREMVSKGVRPVNLTVENRDAFIQALRPAYDQSIERLLGKDFIKRIKATDGIGHPLSSDFAVR